MMGLPVVGGPYDGTETRTRFTGRWVWFLGGGRVTVRPDVAARCDGQLYRLVDRVSLDRSEAPGQALLYSGDIYEHCSGCQGGFRKRGCACGLCGERERGVPSG